MKNEHILINIIKYIITLNSVKIELIKCGEDMWSS